MKLRFAAIALSATLVACGGGSGSGDVAEDNDIDGVPVIGGGDDIDFNGEDDFGGDDLVGGEAINTNNGAACNSLGDGTLIGGSDNDSSTPDWSDNCEIRAGIHEPNTYEQGIQRIIFCRGHTNLPLDAAITTDSLNAFADGDFGTNSSNQLRAFQEAEGLVGDGQVGPLTWAALEDVLEVSANNTLRDSLVHRVSDGVCGGVSQFEQNFDVNTELGGWVMLITPGGDFEAATVPFGLNQAPVQ